MAMLPGPGEVVSMEAKIPPLTPRTRQKMSQAVLDTFKSFEKEQQRLGIPKGEVTLFFVKTKYPYTSTNQRNTPCSGSSPGRLEFVWQSVVVSAAD